MGCRADPGGALLRAAHVELCPVLRSRMLPTGSRPPSRSAIPRSLPAFWRCLRSRTHRRGRETAAPATPHWPEWQTTTVYVTSQRLAVHASGRWLSFEYRAITAVYPREVASATLVCQFDSTEPLLLSGDEAAIAAVLAVTQTHGLEALRDHPALPASRPPAGGTRAPSRRRVETQPVILSELTTPPAKNSASFVPAG